MKDASDGLLALSRVSSRNNFLPGKDVFNTHTNLSPAESLLDACFREMLFKKGHNREARQEADDTISLSSPRGARETAGRTLRYRAALCCLKSEMTTS